MAHGKERGTQVLRRGKICPADRPSIQHLKKVPRLVAILDRVHVTESHVGSFTPMATRPFLQKSFWAPQKTLPDLKTGAFVIQVYIN